MNAAIDSNFISTLCGLVERRMRHLVPVDLSVTTALTWLSLIRCATPTPTGHGMLSPSVCMLVQGEKEMLVGDKVLRYGSGCFFQTGITMPVCGRVTQASAAAPYYGIRVDLDPTDIAAVIIEMAPDYAARSDSSSAVTVEHADNALLEVFIRALCLLDRPSDLPVLGRLIKHEFVYHLLSASGGESLRNSIGNSHRGHGVHEVINWIRTHYNQPLRIDALARAAHMSPSVLHRRFKEATAMSPLQYQKQVRLLEARKMLMSGTTGAATAAYDVGYESPSQFSREYRRLFGTSPLKDADRLREYPVVLEP